MVDSNISMVVLSGWVIPTNRHIRQKQRHQIHPSCITGHLLRVNIFFRLKRSATSP